MTHLDRALDGRIIACSDDSFAAADNLVRAREPEFRFGVFVEGKGQEFDSWESRRHNPSPPDWVIVELAEPGPIGTLDIDTHWHDGNHAEKGALYACAVADDDAPPTRDDERWRELLPPTALDGHAHNVFRVTRDRDHRWTHVMLENHPDGGIARLRCWDRDCPLEAVPNSETSADDAHRIRHPQPIPGKHDDERLLPDPDAIAHHWQQTGDARCNLACETRGARVVATSNNRYGHSQALLDPTPPVSMGDGWETARSRGDDHTDFVVVALGRRGRIDEIQFDFEFFVLNNPVAVTVRAIDAADATDRPLDDWTVLAERVPVKHLAGDSLVLDSSALAALGPFSHVRIDTHPDGGCNRLRVMGIATTA